MTLFLHNSLGGEKQRFIPLQEGRVGLYVCGMTVYDYCHLGHARMLIVFDMLYRYLRQLGFAVHYVRNITDVDDKIIAAAAAAAEPMERLSARYIAAFQEDCQALGLCSPDCEPRATQHIQAMQDLIARLQGRDLAYTAGNGDVCFAIARFPHYGQLSGRRLADLRAGARVAVEPGKRDALDFVLWKKVSADQPGWESPWGYGRPGWHLECSAMSMQYLGEHFDIHGGGGDLCFPHHENEIAQSEGACGGRFVNYWLHNGFVCLEEEKMSKSLGNTLRLRDLLSQYSAEALRYMVLSCHYRRPLHYSLFRLQQAELAVRRLYSALDGVPSIAWQERAETASERAAFSRAMNDDLNTPAALAVLFKMARRLNRQRDKTAEQAAVLAAEVRHLAIPFGLLQRPSAEYLHATTSESLDAEAIETLLSARQEHRQAGRFAAADAIRDRLHQSGIELQDGFAESRWRRRL